MTPLHDLDTIARRFAVIARCTPRQHRQRVEIIAGLLDTAADFAYHKDAEEILRQPYPADAAEAMTVDEQSYIHDVPVGVGRPPAVSDARLVEYLMRYPGVTTSVIVAHFGTKATTTANRLKLLVQRGVLSRVEYGTTHRYFAEVVTE
jgi:hypothetical protein